MAFYTPINPTTDTSYLGLSKETDKPIPLAASEGRPASPIIPAAPVAPPTPVLNTVMPSSGAQYETLFKGLAQGIGLGATGLDAAMQNKIWYEANDKYRQVQNQEFGVGAATTLAGSRVPPTDARGDSSYPTATDAEGNPISILPPGTKSQGKGLPPGAKGIIDNIQSLEEQHKQGVLSQSYYLGVMNAEMSKLIANYPGYEKEIREFTKGILGLDPGDSLRTSLMHDADSRARALQAGQSKELKEVVDAQNKGWLPPTSARDFATGKLDIWTARSIIATRSAKEHQVTATQNQLNLDKAVQADQWGRNYANVSRDFVVQTMNNQSMSPEGAAAIEKLKAGATLTPNEHNALSQSLNEMETNLRKGLAMKSMGINPTTGESEMGPNNSTYTTYLKPEEIDGHNKNALQVFTNYKESIGVKNYSLAGRVAESVKLMEDQRVIDFQKKYPQLSDFGAISKLLGPNTADLVFSQYPQLLSPIVKQMGMMMKVTSLAKPDPDAQSKVLQAAAGDMHTPEEKKALVKADIDFSTSVVSGRTKADPQFIIQQAKQIFHPDNNIFEHLAPSNYAAVYSQYTSPSISAQMEKLKDMGPEGNLAWNRYQKWSADYLPVAIQEEMRVLQRQWQSDARFKVSYDPEKHVLKYEAGEPTNKLQRIQAPGNASAEVSVQKINLNIQNLNKIMEMGGRDVNETISNVFQGMGISLSGQKVDAKPDTSVPNWMLTLGSKAIDLTRKAAPYLDLGQRLPEPVTPVQAAASTEPPTELGPETLRTLPSNQKTMVQDPEGNQVLLVQLQEGGPWFKATPKTKSKAK